MSVIANTISTNTYFFQSSMGDRFDPNSGSRDAQRSVPFLFGRQTQNDINIGGFQVVAGGDKDEGANITAGWSGVKVPVAGIYMCSFNLMCTNSGSWSSTRFRFATMFTVTSDVTAGSGTQMPPNPYQPIKSAMCYIRQASSHNTSSNIQTRLLTLNQGAIVGLACERLGGQSGTTHVVGDRCSFSLAKLF